MFLGFCMRLKFVLFRFWLIPTISSGFILDIKCSRKLNTLRPSKGPTSHTRLIYVYLLCNLVTPAQPSLYLFEIYLQVVSYSYQSQLHPPGPCVHICIPRNIMCSVAQLCLTICDPMNCSQAPLSMGFSWKNTGVGCHFLLQGT